MSDRGARGRGGGELTRDAMMQGETGRQEPRRRTSTSWQISKSAKETCMNQRAHPQQLTVSWMTLRYLLSASSTRKSFLVRSSLNT